MQGIKRFLGQPMGWLTIQIAEYGLLIVFFRWILPEDLPAWLAWPLFIGSIVLLVVVNLRIARRLFPDPPR